MIENMKFFGLSSSNFKEPMNKFGRTARPDRDKVLETPIALFLVPEKSDLPLLPAFAGEPFQAPIFGRSPRFSGARRMPAR